MRVRERMVDHVLRRLSTWRLHGAEKVSNEEGRRSFYHHLVDVCPIEETGENAYAQMECCSGIDV